ncbi:MAG: IspD/TarI family cytidylyltransferase, partial [Bacillota bacterium]
RANLGYNKVFKSLAGHTMLEYPLRTFKEDDACREIILVIDEASFDEAKQQFVGLYDTVVKGGKTRRQSVFNGLKHVKNPRVLIHDGARPFISNSVLQRLKDALENHVSISPAIKVPDTLKRVEEDRVVESLDRENLVALQTPQAFETKTIRKAHEVAKDKHIDATCDLSLVKATLDIQGFIVEGDTRTMKYTHESDDSLLELILDDANRTKS